MNVGENESLMKCKNEMVIKIYFTQTVYKKNERFQCIIDQTISFNKSS